MFFGMNIGVLTTPFIVKGMSPVALGLVISAPEASEIESITSRDTTYSER